MFFYHNFLKSQLYVGKCHHRMKVRTLTLLSALLVYLLRGYFSPGLSFLICKLSGFGHGEGNGNPPESQGWGSLVGCRLWVRQDWSDLAASGAGFGKENSTTRARVKNRGSHWPGPLNPWPHHTGAWAGLTCANPPGWHSVLIEGPQVFRDGTVPFSSHHLTQKNPWDCNVTRDPESHP